MPAGRCHPRLGSAAWRLQACTASTCSKAITCQATPCNLLVPSAWHASAPHSWRRCEPPCHASLDAQRLPWLPQPTRRPVSHTQGASDRRSRPCEARAVPKTAPGRRQLPGTGSGTRAWIPETPRPGSPPAADLQPLQPPPAPQALALSCCNACEPGSHPAGLPGVDRTGRLSQHGLPRAATCKTALGSRLGVTWHVGA